jgi:hypothetical protein
MKNYGLIAEFDSAAAILRAAEKVRDAGYSRWETFTPFPIHGMEKVLGYKNSLVGWFALAFGGGAFLSVAGLIWFANAFDYPLIVGGKPMFSPPMTFVPAYILFIMGGAIGALVGMFATNQLPRWHHPLFKNPRFNLATRDKFFLAIGAADPKFSETGTRKLLEEIGGANIALVEDEE